MVYDNKEYEQKEIEFAEWFMDNYSSECIAGEFWLDSVRRVIEKLEIDIEVEQLNDTT